MQHLLGLCTRNYKFHPPPLGTMIMPSELTWDWSMLGVSKLHDPSRTKIAPYASMYMYAIEHFHEID